LRARLHRINPFRAESVGDLPGLIAPAAVQLYAGHAPDQKLVDDVMDPMPYQ
jgi:hypothetical protein